MSLAIQTIRSATAAEWDQVWGGCDYATYFQSREWAEIWNIYTHGKIRPDPRLVTFSDGKKALLPLSYRRRSFGLVKSHIFSHAATYGGWVSADSIQYEHALLMGTFLTKKLPSLIWKLNPFDELAPRSEVHPSEYDETLVIKLESGFPALLKKWTKGHRSAATKAHRVGVTVRDAQDLEDWQTYYEIFKDSMRRWGEQAFSKYRWELFEEMFRRNSPNIKLWLAIFEGRTVAGVICLYAKKHVVYWHGAALEKFFVHRPVNLLIHSILKDACDREGLSWFDFNPSGALEGVRSFKKGFGAEALECPNVYTEAPWLRLMGMPGRLVSKMTERLESRSAHKETQKPSVDIAGS